MFDLLIIGAGPSGIAAALYASHLGLSVQLIAPSLGGKINWRFALDWIEPVDTVYGAQLVRTFTAELPPDIHLEDSVTEIVASDAGHFVVTTESHGSLEAQSLLISTGAKARRLFVPGEDTYRLKGLSFSSVSHGSLFRGRDVALIGNNDRALLSAMMLSRQVANIHLIAPKPQALNPHLLERLAERGNSHIYRGWSVTRFDGDEFLRSMTLQNASGVTREVKVDGVFVELGLLANSELVAGLVERNNEGRIVIDADCATSRAGIFAAGDVTTAYGEQVPIAIGEGIKAALAVSAYIAQHE
ncbi:MAG: NAD(P)/FAD-dependent oxidoreductase [Anaerolineales bacterium]|nr:NAD(P)/FAD-dependent oxidoreductase [Anaerolineales bacterium]MCB9127828.1 NAD(P)/FAD-dependent oxidoreductase [Ardenticatenales bacterium]MCB9172895.1 NAD(P)/FAD-dependent oxidoreductase [Ardenticatenales bacterium]